MIKYGNKNKTDNETGNIVKVRPKEIENCFQELRKDGHQYRKPEYVNWYQTTK